MQKDLLKKLGEETIYSAKGHFKACDLRRNLVTITIWLCAGINAFGMTCISTSYDKWLSAIGLFGTIGLLIWNEGEGRSYRDDHKRAGEEYLSIHKEIRELFFNDNTSSEEVKSINQKLRELDKSNKPDIPITARKWAQCAIKKHNETDNWFK